MSLEKILLNRRESLYESVHARMTIVEERLPLTKDDHFRASGIYDCCVRQEALFHKFNIIRKNKIDHKLWKTFKFGRSFETFFRDSFLGESKILIGKWKCGICGDTPSQMLGSARYARPDECEICGAKSFSYVEERLISDDLGVGGSPDGFILWNSEYYVLELKTTNSFNYTKVQGEPLPQHRAQAQVYMHVSGYRRAIIWYFNKDTSEDICHDIHYDKEYAQRLLEKPRQYRQYLSSGILPPKVCPTNTCSKAKKCQVSQLCFQD